MKSTMVRTTLAVIFFLTVAGNLFPQSKKLNLDQAIQIALRNNREVRIAELEVEKANQAVKEAFGNALPSLDFSAGFSRFMKKPKMPFPDFQAMLGNAVYGILFNERLLPFDPSKFSPLNTKLQAFAQRNNYQASFKITQILFNSAVFRGIGASHIYLNLSKERLKSTIAKTTFNVKKAYYGVLLAKEMLKITKERFHNAQENLKMIKAMKKHGLVSDFDEMQVEVQVENILPVVTQLENVLQNAKNGLKIVLGLSQDEELEVEGKLKYWPENLPGESDLIAQAMDSNLDLKTLKIKKDVDNEFIEIDRSDYWPTLVAFGDYTFAGSDDHYDFQNYQSSTIGLSLSINLFKGTRVYHKVEQDEIAVMQTDEQIKNLSDAIVTKVKAKLHDLNRVREQINAMERNVALAEKAYKIAQVRYKEGTGTQLELKNADVELNVAKTNKIKAVADYLTAKAELDYLLGKLDTKYVDNVKKYLNK